jgi:hypothetical protein
MSIEELTGRILGREDYLAGACAPSWLDEATIDFQRGYNDGHREAFEEENDYWDRLQRKCR